MAGFCNKCGSKLRDGSKFCPKCGNTIIRRQQQPQAAPKESSLAHVCGNCGASLREGSKFCPKCGTAVDSETTANTQEDVVIKPEETPKLKTVAQAVSAGSLQAPLRSVQGLERLISAPSDAGMTSFDISGTDGSVREILSSGQAFFSIFSRIGSGFKTFSKNPLALIPAVIFAIIWFVLHNLRYSFPQEGVLTKFFSWLTYGGDASYRSLLGAFGTSIGRGIVCMGLTSVFMGGFGRMKSAVSKKPGVKSATASGKLSVGNTGSWFLTGLGAGIVINRLIEGTPSFSHIIVTLSAVFLSIQALGNENGWLYSFATSFTSRIDTNRKRTANEGAARKLMSGFATGLTIMAAYSVLYSVIVTATGGIGASFFSAFPTVIGVILFVIGLIISLSGKNHKNGAKALVGIILLVTFGTLFPATEIRADEDDGNIYKWTLVGTEVYRVQDTSDGYYTNKYTIEGSAGGAKGTFRGSFDYENNHDSAAFTMTCSAPPAVIYGGDEVTFDISCHMTEDKTDLLMKGWCWVEMDQPGIGHGSSSGYGATFENIKNKNGQGSYKGSCEAVAFGEAEAEQEARVYAVMPRSSDGSQVSIYFESVAGKVEWRYKCEVTAAATPTPEPAKIEPEPVEITPTPTPTPTPEPKEDKWEDIVVESEAKDKPVETDEEWNGFQDGGQIKNEIVEGWDKTKDDLALVGGIVAAGGLAGLLADGRGDKDKKKKKKYRMVIYKDFGSIIYRGNTETVYACIVETDENGGECVSPILTEKIRIFSSDGIFNIYERGIEGEYKSSQVSVSDELPDNVNEGIVSFKFTGEGGTFTNQMKFRISGLDNIEVNTPALGPEEDKPTAIDKAIVEGTISANPKKAGDMSLDEIYAEDTRDYSGYRMMIYKSTGDCVRKGTEQGIWVTARIEEYRPVSNHYVYRDDLTAQIQCFSGDGHIEVSDQGLSENGCAYKNAYVTVGGDSTESTGKVSFRFTGKGGTYTRHVIFRIVGEPQIVYPVFSQSGEILSYDGTGEINVIAGDGDSYEVAFAVVDTAKKPKVDKACDTLSVEIIEPGEGQNLYYARFTNTTAALDEENVFAERETHRINLYADDGEGGKAEDHINVFAYPEGLSVSVEQADIEEGFAVVNCYMEEGFYGNDEEAEKYYVHPLFKFLLAVKDGRTVSVLSPERSMVTLGKLKSDDYISNNIMKKYRYRIDWLAGDEAEFYFHQEQDLFEAEHKYLGKMQAKVSYEQRTYEADIPLRLKGAYFKDMEGLDRELKKLLWIMRRYIEDDAARAEMVFFVKERLATSNVTAHELHMMGKQIYAAWLDQATSEANSWLLKADIYDWALWGADWTKYICILSFTYVAKAYAIQNTGSTLAGDITEAIVQPCASIVLDFCEEISAVYLWGEHQQFKVENLKIYEQLSNASDSLAWNWASRGITENPGEWKQNLSKIAAYFALMVIKNFYRTLAEKGEADIAGAIWDAFKDLTTNALKLVAGELFKMWLKSEMFQRRVGEKIADKINNYLADNIKNLFQETLESGLFKDQCSVCQKILDEAVGNGIAKAVELGISRVSNSELSYKSKTGEEGIFYTFMLFEGNDGNAPVYCELDLVKAVSYTGPALLGEPVTILFEALFGKFEGAQEPVQFEADPPSVRKDEIITLRQTVETININLTDANIKAKDIIESQFSYTVT